jgi:hemolysin activation/secretion protein
MLRSVISGQIASRPSRHAILRGLVGAGCKHASPISYGARARGQVDHVDHVGHVSRVARASLSGFVLASAFFGLADAAAAADLPVEEFRVRWLRPVGLPEFENPRNNVRLIEDACAEYLAALGGEDKAGLLAPMPLTLLNNEGRFAAVVRKPSAAAKPLAECGPDDFENAKMVAPNAISTVAQGVYQSAVQFLVARADAWDDSPAAEAEDAEAQRKAVRAFRAALTDSANRTLENEAFNMRLGVENPEANNPRVLFYGTRVAVDGENLLGTQQESQSLPRLTAGFRVESSTLPGLAEQFEAALEENFVLQSSEGPVPLDFEVGAAHSADGKVVELTAAFVGPKEAPAIPVKSFVLNYRGGDGSILKTAPVGEGAEGAPSDAFYDLPPAETVLGATTVTLFRVRDGERTFLTDWVADPSAAERVDLRLDTVFEQPEMFTISALQSVFLTVLETLQAAEGDGGVAGGDLIGVYVDADDGQLDLSRGCTDTRSADTNGAFAIKAVPGIVNSVRTIASGERVEPADRVNTQEARFQRLLANAPFQPGSATPQVLREEPLREYLDKQSRHPNRRVDAAITAADASAASQAEGAPQWGAQGTVGVDFLVTENKPWAIFLQGANTGVESTGEWQTRVGFFNSDVFGNDEIFSIEYVTTNFTDSNAVNAYFDAPIGESESLRWKLFAGYSQYNAEDVGFAFADFEGESPLVGGEVAWNVAQWGKTFLDVLGGVSWTNVNVFNGLTGDTGDEDFLIPYVGARLQRNNRDATTDFAVYLDFGLGGDASQADLNKLGRLFPSQDWQMLRWDLAQSFYLDPLFQDPADIANATLAHELYFRFRGQNSLGNRLVPQFMGTAGGYYTVRGYPTSLAAGDNLYLMTAEYRLHLPQLLGIDPNPQPFMGIGNEPFRLRPQFGYGPTDWDFIVRGFVDAGFVENVDPLSFEEDTDLLGAGFGVELQTYKGLAYPTLRNMSLRLDVGFPLIDPDFTEVDDVQFTFVGTLSF